jgi:hypothetical protein
MWLAVSDFNRPTEKLQEASACGEEELTILILHSKISILGKDKGLSTYVKR